MKGLEPRRCCNCQNNFWTARRYQSRCDRCQDVADRAAKLHRQITAKRLAREALTHG